MKFVIGLVLLYVCIVSARHVQNEHFKGDVRNGKVIGTIDVNADLPESNNPMEYTKYEFTFPEVSK